jgi:hypothetical protein
MRPMLVTSCNKSANSVKAPYELGKSHNHTKSAKAPYVKLPQKLHQHHLVAFCVIVLTRASISFEKDNFYIDLQFHSFSDRDEFNDAVVYLKQHYIGFDVVVSKWKIPSNKIQEIILWMDRDNKPYSIDDACADRFIEMQKEYLREVEFFRNRKFDYTILNKDVELKNESPNTTLLQVDQTSEVIANN